MTDKLVTIASFTDSIQASMAKQRLADFGIKSFLAGYNATNVYTLPAVAAVELQVLEKWAQKAKEILNPQSEQEQ
jgi:hypothetical protein